MRKLPNTEEEINDEAKKLGITFHTSANSTGLDHAEMQKRIIAARADKRDSTLWLIALVSSIASAISAATAIVAVLSK